MGRVTVSVAGQTAHADYTVTAQAALIGSSTELAFPIVVPSMASYRHYFQPDDWSGTKQPRFTTEAKLKAAYDTYGVRDVSISFKPGYTATKVRTFLASCPADLRPWGTFFHQHDMDIANGSLTIAAYRAGCYEIADLMHEAGHLFGPIHNGSTRQGGAPSSDTTKPWGYWIDVWKMRSAPLEVCDFWGFDTYAETYQAPVPRLNPVLTYQAEHGLPLLVGETGAPNTNDASQALYATRFRGWCLEHTSLACWWHNQFTGKPPYPMTANTARAWFAL